MSDITLVEGIGDVYGAELRKAGIETTEALLEMGATPAGRQKIAEKTGISAKLILTWINHVDLFRINGVSEEYADLLEAAGVDTVPELAQRNAENLHVTLVETNERGNLVRRLPGLSDVADWIEQAKGLPRIITY
jgi:predicted flap endonuclease-1-like 5' DNA nuclease